MLEILDEASASLLLPLQTVEEEDLLMMYSASLHLIHCLDSYWSRGVWLLLPMLIFLSYTCIQADLRGSKL